VKTHSLCSRTFVFENHGPYEIMRKKRGAARHATDYCTVHHRKIRFACRI